MSDEAAFLRAIRDEPDDDAPRLVFADWLDDHGRARWAALIRRQCALARLDPWDADWQRAWYEPDWISLTGRGLHTATWNPDFGLDEPTPGWWSNPRRGLPAAVLADNPGTFLAAAKLAFDMLPVEEVILSGMDDRFSKFVASPWLARLSGIECRSGATAEPHRLRALLESPHAVGLRELRLRGFGLESLAVLVGSPAFGRLETFRSPFQSASRLVELLAARTASGMPIRLDLSETAMTDANLDRLVPFMTGVTDLKLDNNLLTPDGPAILRSLVGLRVLSVSGRISAAAARLLLTLPALRWLSLSGSGLGKNDVQTAFADAPAGLRALGLAGNPIGDHGLAGLVRWPGIAELSAIRLAGCNLTDKGGRALLDSHALDAAGYVDLRENRFGADVRAALVSRFGNRLRL